MWSTEGIGDGKSTGYTQDDVTEMYRMLWNQDPTTEGYATGYLNELAITNPAGTTVRLASGGAVVYGFPYRNTGNVDFVPFTPALGNTGWRVVLRTDWTLRTVRGVLLQSADGVAAYPGLTQNAGYRWEISLARGTITNLGAVTVDFDDRTSVGSGGRFIVTPDDIQDRTRRIFIPATGGYETAAIEAQSIPHVWPQGWDLADAIVRAVVGDGRIPTDFVSGATVSALVQSGANGNVWVNHIAHCGAVGEDYSIHTVTSGAAAVAVVANQQALITPLNLAAAALGDYLHLWFWRDGTNGSDTTTASLHFLGWLLEYTADS